VGGEAHKNGLALILVSCTVGKLQKTNIRNLQPKLLRFMDSRVMYSDATVKGTIRFKPIL